MSINTPIHHFFEVYIPILVVVGVAVVLVVGVVVGLVVVVAVVVVAVIPPVVLLPAVVETVAKGDAPLLLPVAAAPDTAAAEIAGDDGADTAGSKLSRLRRSVTRGDDEAIDLKSTPNDLTASMKVVLSRCICASSFPNLASSTVFLKANAFWTKLYKVEWRSSVMSLFRM